MLWHVAKSLGSQINLKYAGLYFSEVITLLCLRISVYINAYHIMSSGRQVINMVKVKVNIPLPTTYCFNHF